MFFQQSLRTESAEFRLIRRRSSSDPAVQLDFEMTVASLHAPPPYQAISYHCIPSPVQVDVRINGHTASVATTLRDDLLRVCAAPGSDTWLWVDAFCVNHRDVAEKNWQVVHMHRIFSGATSVFFCVGPADDCSELLFDFLIPWGRAAAEADMYPGDGATYGLRIDPPTVTKKFVKTLISTEDIYAKGLHDSIEKLSHRPFWNRCWIIHELCMAKRGLVLCGTKIMDLHDFHAIMTALSQVSRWRAGAPPLGDGVIFNPSAVNFAMLGIDTHVRGEDPSLTLRHTLQSRARRFNTVAAQGPFYQALDPRDVIFAFRGMAADRARLRLPPADYAKSVREVYTEATVAMMQLEPKQPVLDLAAFPKDVDDLPSWVPDWSRIGRLGLFEPLSRLGLNFAIFGDAEDTTEAFFIDTYTLRRMGFPCGTVAAVLHVDAPVSLTVDTPTDPAVEGDTEALAVALSTNLQNEATRAACIAHMLTFMLYHTFTLDSTEDDSAETRLWRTLTADLYRDTERLPAYRRFGHAMMTLTPLRAAELTAADMDYIWAYTTPEEARRDGSTPQAVVDIFVKDAWEQAIQITANRTLIATMDGQVGLGPCGTAPGDRVTALSGSDVPLLLREVDGGGYEYVGEAFLEGIMYGELMEAKRKWQCFDII